MDQIGGLLQQYANGSAPQNPAEVHAHYDQIARTVPESVLKSVIGPALGSLSRNEVEAQVQNSASQMDPGQRGELVSALLRGLTSGGNLTSVLSQLGLSPAIAENPQQATPSEVGTLAAHVQQTRPDVFNAAMQFYARHPTLVKVMGTLAMAKIAEHLSRHPTPAR
jgi:hypothetical protein